MKNDDDKPNLSLTFGFGPSLFEHDGDDRYGLAGQRPAALADLPDFPNQQIDPKISGGALSVQACANEAQVAFNGVRLGAAANNGGSQILRRAYNYAHGVREIAERWPPWKQHMAYEAGLLFNAYQNDPRTGFTRIFNKMALIDQLNQFAVHTGSGLFACPGGIAEGDYVGSRLLAST